MSNAKDIFQQLGVSANTARNQLNRRIMFSFVQRLGLDICFRCHQKILMFEEMSVDHKRPWFRISKELFWDLNNIAFL